MHDSQREIVGELHTVLQTALSLIEELREIERTSTEIQQKLNFQGLSRDQVERWYAHTQAVAAGRTATM